MLKQITLPYIRNDSAPLIKRYVIEGSQIYKSLDTQARHNARKIIQQANQQATDIYHSAYQEGFELGLRLLVQNMAQYISVGDELSHILINHALQHTEQKLRDFFMEEEVIEHLTMLMVHYFTESDNAPVKLILTLPEKSSQLTSRLKNHLLKAGIKPEVKYGRADTITLEYGKEIWSSQFSELAGSLAKSAVEKTLSELPVTQICREQSRKSLQSIVDTLNAFLQHSAPENI